MTASRRLTSFGRVEGVDEFCRMARRLGDRLGPLRFKVPQARDDGFLRLLLDALDPEIPVALDFRHDSWDDPEVTARLDERGVARAGAWDGRRRLPLPAPARAAVRRGGARRRSPPRSGPRLAAGVDVYAFFRHEDEPTAPLSAGAAARAGRGVGI